MRSTLATDVPPNFITTTAIKFPAVRFANALELAFKGCPPQTGEPGPKGLQTAMSEQKSRLRPVLLTASAGPRNIRALTIFARAARILATMQAEPSVLSADPTLDLREVERFERLAGAWWDPNGKFRPLHQQGPARLRFIRDALVRHFKRPPEGGIKPLQGLSVLDVGCGGGLVSEPLARLGARVTGIDPTPEAIATARGHAEAQGLAIDYRAARIEELRGGRDLRCGRVPRGRRARA